MGEIFRDMVKGGFEKHKKPLLVILGLILFITLIVVKPKLLIVVISIVLSVWIYALLYNILND